MGRFFFAFTFSYPVFLGMNFWNQASLVRILFSFAAGILFRIYFELQFAFPNLLIGLLIIVLFVVSESKNSKLLYHYRWISGILIGGIFFIIGIQLTQLQNEITKANHFLYFSKSASHYLVQLNEPLIQRAKTRKAEIKVVAVNQNGHWIYCRGKALLYLQNDSNKDDLYYGDQLVIGPKFTSIVGPQNPSEFNYKRYLQFQNIAAQTYQNTGNWKKVKAQMGNTVRFYCYRLRDYLLSVFQQNGIEGKEFAVGAALILGYEDRLDAEIMNAYAASGALHVLSVSGLHVAIVFVVLNYVLLFCEKLPKGKLIKASILILFLWFYAALTGLSPSVLRSAAMFTFIILGKALNRYSNIYNTLAASMFLLLVYNPFLLMEVGFQLSYLAVLGIVSLQEGIRNLLRPKTFILQKIWDIISVTLAAQLTTFPLGLLYFHQFPSYFLLSNIVIIPLSTLVLYLGVAVCMVSKIKLFSLFVCKILSVSLTVLNYSVTFFQDLPFSTINGIPFTACQALAIYGALFGFCIFLMFQRIPFLKVGLLSLGMFIGLLSYAKHHQLRQCKLVVYNIKKHSAIDFIVGQSNYLISNVELMQNDGKLLFHIKPNWWELGIKNSVLNSQQSLKSGITTKFLCAKGNVVQFKNTRLFAINRFSATELYQLSKLGTLDFVLVSDNKVLPSNTSTQKFLAKHVILDSSNSTFGINWWKKYCKKNNISCYSVSENGAFSCGI